MSDMRQVLPGAPTAQWTPWGSYQDILVDRCADGLARVAINRPAKRNAFRPQTVMELCDAFTRIRDDRDIGVVLFTGVGPAPMVAMPSVPAVTRVFAATAVTSVRTACPA